MLLQPSDHVLFYGDSITDAGRRAEQNNNRGLGVGYPALCAAALWARYPDWDLRFTNQGISGNRLVDLEARLEADVLAAKPTLVSILIGINDTWRRYDRQVVSPLDEFVDADRADLSILLIPLLSYQINIVSRANKNVSFKSSTSFLIIVN